MNLLGRMKYVFTNNFNEYTKAFLRGDDIETTNGVISNELAMKYSAVFACVRVLSETLASLPINVYRKTTSGDKEEGRDIGIYDILHNAPNYDMTPFNFKEALMSSLCLNGNGLATKVVNDKGELLALYPLSSDIVEIKRDATTKNLTYDIKNGIETKTMTRRYVFHIPGMSLNGINGLSPISYAAKAIELGLTYETFGVNFYKNGANTNMALTHPGSLKDNAYERLKKQVTEKHTGLANVNRPWLLEEGMTIKELTIKPVDAQLLESKYFQLEDICRIYRVPQHLIQLLNRSTNNNIEHQSLEFVMYTMLPWFKRWEENINLQLLTSDERKAGYFTEFKVDALLRGDAASRATAYATGRNGGWLSVNDIRRLENMNPIPNGDIYLMPLNYIEAGTVQQTDQTQAMAEQIYNMITNKVEKT